MKSGIYFLINHGIVIYVGQTKRYPLRLKEHRHKTYDSIRFIECSIDELRDKEAWWIRKLKPKYNFIVGRKPVKDKKIAVQVYVRKSRIKDFGGMKKAREAILQLFDRDLIEVARPLL